MEKKLNTEEVLVILTNRIDFQLDKIPHEKKQRNERLIFESVFLKDDLDDEFNEDLLKSSLSEKYNAEVDLRIMGDYYKYQLIMRF